MKQKQYFFFSHIIIIIEIIKPREKINKKIQKNRIKKYNKTSIIITAKKISIFLQLQAFFIEIKKNFSLSSSVNWGIFLKSNLFISLFDWFQKSFWILSSLPCIYFFLIEFSNLKLSKDLTKVLSIILKTIFNIDIKPPIIENNSR